MPKTFTKTRRSIHHTNETSDVNQYQCQYLQIDEALRLVNKLTQKIIYCLFENGPVRIS